MSIEHQVNLSLIDKPDKCLDLYVKLNRIAYGSFGEVYMAEEKSTGKKVALKKLKFEKRCKGFPLDALREIYLLRKFKHDNVISLLDVITSLQGSNIEVYLVFEYMEHSLASLTDAYRDRLTPSMIKLYLQELLRGLQFLQENQILHRDIKGGNILVDNQGRVKIADFGMSRPMSVDLLTEKVITKNYKPPEILVGSSTYNASVDIWSVACTFARIVTGRHIFEGKTEVEVLKNIVRICGSPKDKDYPGFSANLKKKNISSENSKYCLIESFERNLLDTNTTKLVDDLAKDLFKKMLMFDPKMRISVHSALAHPYFSSDPLPCNPKSMPSFPESHRGCLNKRQPEDEEIGRKTRQKC